MSRLAIFDFDGTLVDSAPAIEQALIRSFEAVGRVSPGRERCRRVIGLSLWEAASQLMPDAEAETIGKFAAAFSAVFHEVRSNRINPEPLFEGVLELLDALREDGWLLAIATGNTRRGVERPLRAHGLEDRFVSLQTADDHPSKPHPSMIIRAMADAGATPASTIVIGDSTFDMQMARAAGACAIGAAWGCNLPQDLMRAGAAAIAHGPLDILALAPVVSRTSGFSQRLCA